MLNGFGSVLRQLRKELGLSQLALADKVSSTQRHLSFLETGRSNPSRQMIGRLVTELNLSAAQRASLFEASGFHSPYKKREFASTEVLRALDVIENRILAHWPFPGFVLNADWDVLRMNKPARAMFAQQTSMDVNRLNALVLFLSEEFRNRIENWEEASMGLYFRLQAEAVHSPAIARAFEEAQKSDIFDHVANHLTQSEEIPIFVPMIMKTPDGQRLTLSSVLGQLATVHDATVEGFQIELMVPVDEQSEAILLATNPRGCTLSGNLSNDAN